MAKLIDINTCEEIEVGSFHTLRGELFDLISFELPRSINSTGRVTLRSAENGYYDEVFPSIIGAEIVDYCPNCQMESDDFEPYNDPDGHYNTICVNCEWLQNDPRNDKKPEGGAKE